MHYYQFNIGDYAKATRHLSNLEDLAYRRLIELYYDTEKPLITDVKKLARLINMRENQEEIETVLEDFFFESEGFYVQNRIEEELICYHLKASVARANGAKGGRPPKPKPNPVGYKPKPKPNPDKTGSKANQEPETKNQKPKTNKKSFVENSEEFHLAKLLSGLILDNNPENKDSINAQQNNYQKWSDEIRKINKIDNRSFQQIEYLIKWTQNDSFWFKNILSPKKLREKFDQLVVQAKERKDKSPVKIESQSLWDEYQQNQNNQQLEA